MRLHRWLRTPLPLAPVLALALLAGCGHSGGQPTAGSSPSAPSEAQLVAIGRQYSQCVRDHGVADFPDLVVANGYLAMPDGAGGDNAKRELGNNPGAQQACASLLDGVPESKHKDHVPTAAELQQMMQFAQCMRDNGIPEWPDPNPDGTFPLPSQLRAEGKSDRVGNVVATCNHFLGEQDGIAVK